MNQNSQQEQELPLLAPMSSAALSSLGNPLLDPPDPDNTHTPAAAMAAAAAAVVQLLCMRPPLDPHVLTPLARMKLGAAGVRSNSDMTPKECTPARN